MSSTSQSNPAPAMISAMDGWPSVIHDPIVRALRASFDFNSIRSSGKSLEGTCSICSEQWIGFHQPGNAFQISRSIHGLRVEFRSHHFYPVSMLHEAQHVDRLQYFQRCGGQAGELEQGLTPEGNDAYLLVGEMMGKTGGGRGRS